MSFRKALPALLALLCALAALAALLVASHPGLAAPSLYSTAALGLLALLAARANSREERRLLEGHHRTEEERHKDRVFVQRILDICPVVYVYDVLEQQGIPFNPRTLSALGYSAEGREGEPPIPTRLMHPEDLPRFRAHLERLRQLANGEILEFEYRLQHRDGRWRWFLSRDTALTRDASGAVRQIVGSAVDITERKHSEEKSEEARSLLETLYTGAPIGLAYYDRELRCVLINDLLAQLNGLPARTNQGRHVLELMPPPFNQQVATLLRRVLDSGEAITNLEISSTEPATPCTWRVSLYPVLCAQRLVGVGCIVEDVTERKRLERELLESRDSLNKLIAFTPNVAIETFDRQLRVLSWNKAAEHIYGYPEEEIRNKSLLLVLQEEDAHEYKRELQVLAQTGQPIGPRECHIQRRDGTRGVVLSTTFMLPTAAGDIFACMDVDITGLKRSEQEKAHLVEELRTAVQARDDFLMIASHELKTPLTALRIQIESLSAALKRQEEALGGQGSRLLNKVEKANQQIVRLAKLVEELLDISRIAQGRLSLSLEELELEELCREVIERFSEQASKAGAPIRLALRGEARGRWDRMRLEQVLTNLLSNALKFGQGKPIDICLEGDPGAIQLTVKDYGIGIPPEAQRRLFEKFERAVSIRHYGGLGLGLYITRQIIEAHGGAISVVSEPERGTTFLVQLPRGLGREPQSSTPERPALPAAQGLGASGPA